MEEAGSHYLIRNNTLFIDETLRYRLNKDIYEAMKKVKRIEFGKFFSGNIDGKIPDNVEEIIFGKYFNNSVRNLPKNLKKLIFERQFNNDVDNLPNGLIELEFSEEFNQPIDNLPKSLKILRLGEDFDQPIDFLPPELKYLSIGWSFDQKLDNLPNKLRTLKLSCDLGKFSTIDNLPDSIEKLKIPFYTKKINKLPASLKKIYINEDYEHELPKGDYEITRVTDNYYKCFLQSSIVIKAVACNGIARIKAK